MNPQLLLPETLTFSALSTTVPLLSTSPAWPEVESALARLRGGGDERGDAAIVQEYAGMLQERERLLGFAFVLGAWLGRFADGENLGGRIQKGLEAATGAERLKSGTVEDMLSMVVQLLEELPLEGAEAVRMIEQITTDWTTASEKWIQLRDELEKVAWPTPIARLIEDAWAEWLDRWKLSSESSSVPASVTLLACMAARKGPAAWLRLRPEEMTINELSRATLRSLRVVPPPKEREDLPGSFALVGMRLLGFERAVVDSLSLHGGHMSAVATKVQPARMQKVQAERVPSFIVVRPPRRPLWRGARPVPGIAILTMDVAEFDAAVHGILIDDLELTSPDLRLVVGLDEDGQDPPQITKALRTPLIRSMERIDIYPGDPRGTPSRPFLVAPRSPAELKRWAEQQSALKGATPPP
jgi:hypothetical protein